MPVGCGTQPTGDSDAGSTSAEGSATRTSVTAAEDDAAEQTAATQKMVGELERLHKETLARPRFYYYLNLERAERIREQAAGQSPSAALRQALATELLNGGETEAAIHQIETLLEESGGLSAPLTRDRATLVELLAVSYLRLGEQQNCIAHPTAASCILPFSKSAVHRHSEGSRRAVELYTLLLSRQPADYASRWLLNIAYMTLGRYPDGVPEDLLISGLKRNSASRFPQFSNVAVDLGVGLDNLAGGVAVDDFDGDGFLDIFTTAHRLSDASRLFLNDGNGGFVDGSRPAGLDGISGGLNVVHADYNNDGHNDVLILRGGWLGEAGRHPNSLLKNNGDGTFQDVTEAAGLLSYHPSQAAAFRDFDNDGWLDLFIGNEESDRWLQAWQAASSDLPEDGDGHPSQLYKNNGDGTFTEVARQVGIDVRAFVKGVAWGDTNNDGLPDLYVSIIGSPNRLFMNRGPQEPSGWKFEEVSAGIHQPFFSFPAWFFDVDNDGWEDLFVAPYDLRRINDAAGDVTREYLGRPVDTEMPRLFRNNADGTFTDVTEAMGLYKVLFAMGSNFGDLDNDGYLDIYIGTGTPDLRSVVPNRMFHNVGGRRFEEVTIDGGFGHIQKGHAVAFGDVDMDGDQDLYASIGGVFEGDSFSNVLFENPGSAGDPAWVALRLEGRRSNRSAIGARIRVTTRQLDGTHRSFHRTVSTGGSFGSSSLQQEIGLGSGEHIDEVRITWPNPDRTVEVFTDLHVNRYYEVVEGSGEVVVVPTL